MSDSFDFVNAHHAEKRSPYARPGPIPDSRLNIFHLDHAASIVRRATSSESSTESSTSTSAVATSCGPKDTTGPCERYASNTSDATLPIVLGVLIPLGVAFIALIVLHRMHVRKLRREDAEDRQKSLDFGIVMSESEKRNKHNKNKKGAAGPEMSIADTTRAARGGRGVSMDLGTSNPYMLPPGLHHSRESLHSLSRALQSGDDKYASVDFIPDDGSMRSASRQRQNPDDSSSHTSSNKRAFDTQSTKGLLMSDSAKSESDGRLEVPLRKPAAAATSTNTKNGLLAPAAPDGRESIVSTASSNGAFRKSNDYLGAYIRGGEPPAKTTESPTELATPANDVQPEPVLKENDARLSPPAITRQDDGSRPQRPERPVDGPRFQTEQSDAAPPNIDSGVAPKLPELRIPDSSPTQDGHASNLQRGFEPPQTGVSAQMSRPRDENTSESFPAYDSPAKAGPDGQHWNGHAPGTHGAPYVEEDDYYDPGEDYGNPYDDYQNHYDPRWVTPGMRPLPPDDPSENPEQRANRIRSFYKEYFDESGKGQHGVLEGGYYEDQEYAYNYQHPPSQHGPGGRQRATFSNGSQMPGPRAFSSASGRYGNGMGPRPPLQPQPRAEPKKRAPPPKALSIIPTPSKLKDDTFIIDQSIDFAPPLRAVMQRSGTPDSGRGGAVPFSPTVRAHVPLASSYDDLAVMPSPHMLRKSGTFTALDFAPPRFRANHDSMSDAGSIRSARSGTSLSTQRAIRAGAYRVSRIPKDVVGTQGEINNALKPQWDMR